MGSDSAMRVLIVEDNPGDAQLLRVWLAESRSPRFRVSHAARLDEAGAFAEAIAYDAVLLDLSLPDSCGVDTVTRFRERSPDAAIVVVSGQEDAGVATDSVHQGAHEYLVKGEMTGRSLRAAITRAVARHQLATGALKLVQQARASTSRLRGILHELPDGLVIHDEDGLIVYANPAAERLIGGRTGSVLPPPFVRTEAEWHGVVEVNAPDGTSSTLEAIGRTVDGDSVGSRILLLRPGGDHAEVGPASVPRDRVTLRASLDCAVWRVARLVTLLHELFERSTDPHRIEALELAEAVARLLDDVRRAVAPSPPRAAD